MRPDKYLVDSTGLLVSAFGALALFASPVYAQNNGNNGNGNTGNNGGNNNDDNENDNTEDAPTQGSEPTESAPPAAESSAEPEPSNEPAPEPETSSVEPQEEETSSVETPSISQTGDASPTSLGQPAITGGVEGGEIVRPTLTGDQGVPAYPSPTVPPTHNAPFMQHSTLPSGTVFIAVGAILGAFGLAILLWRLIVSCLLHRSVKRAALAQHEANTKATFPAPPAPFYKYTDHGSTMSISGNGRGVRRTNRGPIPSSNPSQSNLFFSPTAASGNAAGNRSSAFLPSGFYAAGSPSPGPGGHGHSISLADLRPDSRGHYGNASRHTLNQTPPDSPSFPARRDLSATSLSLNRPPSQRAPSAYLDDLLADDPSSFPPPQMPPSSGPRRPDSTNSNNRI